MWKSWETWILRRLYLIQVQSGFAIIVTNKFHHKFTLIFKKYIFLGLNEVQFNDI